MRIVRMFLLCLVMVGSVLAQPTQVTRAGSEPVLPPIPAWAGASSSLTVTKGHHWITPAEGTDFRTTPSYDDTVTWLRRLTAAAPELRLISLGKSAEGRDLWMVIASKERIFTPQALRRKPILLAQAGIHAGEIDGKDAGMMLLRDMTFGKRRALLDRANFLFVPMFNPDGHERASPFNRINQRGPENMGWRTTSQNLNLNRDYMKLDAPEMRAMIRALHEWQPDLYLDLHVTDGLDYQHDITWGHDPETGYSPAIARWLTRRFTPSTTEALRKMGHIPGPFIFPINEIDYEDGIEQGHSKPRFSSGYGDARHIATVLVENHSLKPYRQRVLGTYVVLANALTLVGSSGVELREAAKSDRARRPDSVTLAWDYSDEIRTIPIAAIESRKVLSPITGSTVVRWTGKPVTTEVRVRQRNKPLFTARRPRAYWIPPAWNDVIERLSIHGIQMERLPAPRTVSVEMYRLQDPKFETDAFEGHVRVSAKPVSERRNELYPAGSVRIPTDQPLGDLAMLLLEPSSPDSFFEWGFFLQVLQRTEYVERYIMEPTAARMLEDDPQLAEEFQKKLATDAAFRGDPDARLQWFYDRTPFTDTRWRLYPVGREVGTE